jgi:hypothetical protein
MNSLEAVPSNDLFHSTQPFSPMPMDSSIQNPVSPVILDSSMQELLSSVVYDFLMYNLLFPVTLDSSEAVPLPK